MDLSSLMSRLGFGKSASVSVRTLKVAEFRSEMEQSQNRLLIDVREPDEYKSGFIPGRKTSRCLSWKIGSVRSLRIGMCCSTAAAVCEAKVQRGF